MPTRDDVFELTETFNLIYQATNLMGSTLTLSSSIAISTFAFFGWWPNLVSLLLSAIDFGLGIWGLLMFLQVDDSDNWGAESSYRAYVVSNLETWVSDFSAPWSFIWGLMVQFVATVLNVFASILSMLGITVPTMTFPWGYAQAVGAFISMIAWFFYGSMEDLYHYYDEDEEVANDECYNFFADDYEC